MKIIVAASSQPCRIWSTDTPMIFCLRLPSSAALMIIACHKRRLLDVLIGGQNKRILLDLVRTTQISSAVRDWLKAPPSAITMRAQKDTQRPVARSSSHLISNSTCCPLYSLNAHCSPLEDPLMSPGCLPNKAKIFGDKPRRQ